MAPHWPASHCARSCAPASPPNCALHFHSLDTPPHLCPQAQPGQRLPRARGQQPGDGRRQPGAGAPVWRRQLLLPACVQCLPPGHHQAQQQRHDGHAVPVAGGCRRRRCLFMGTGATAHAMMVNAVPVAGGCRRRRRRRRRCSCSCCCSVFRGGGRRTGRGGGLLAGDLHKRGGAAAAAAGVGKEQRRCRPRMIDTSARHPLPCPPSSTLLAAAAAGGLVYAPAATPVHPPPLPSPSTLPAAAAGGPCARLLQRRVQRGGGQGQLCADLRAAGRGAGPRLPAGAWGAWGSRWRGHHRQRVAPGHAAYTLWKREMCA